MSSRRSSSQRRSGPLSVRDAAPRLRSNAIARGDAARIGLLRGVSAARGALAAARAPRGAGGGGARGADRLHGGGAPRLRARAGCGTGRASRRSPVRRRSWSSPRVASAGTIGVLPRDAAAASLPGGREARSFAAGEAAGETILAPRGGTRGRAPCCSSRRWRGRSRPTLAARDGAEPSRAGVGAAPAGASRGGVRRGSGWRSSRSPSLSLGFRGAMRRGVSDVAGDGADAGRGVDDDAGVCLPALAQCARGGPSGTRQFRWAAVQRGGRSGGLVRGRRSRSGCRCGSRR